MGVKFTTTSFRKTASVAGGDAEFWKDCAVTILTKLYELGLPIQIETLWGNSQTYSDGMFSGSAYAVFEGEGETNMETGPVGSYIGISFQNSSGEEIMPVLVVSGGMNESFSGTYPYFSYDGYVSSKSYDFTINSCKVGDSFIFSLSGFDPLIITPMRSLSNPSKYCGYGAVSAVMLLPNQDPLWNGMPANLYYKNIPYLEGYDYDSVNWPPMPGYANSLDISTLPDKDSGKIITIPIFSGVADIYFQDVYLTNLNHSKNIAKVFETDQGALLVIQEDLIEMAGLFPDKEVYTSWEQYPIAQIALDVSSAYNT